MPSEASRLLGEIPLDEADEVVGLLSFSGKSTFLDAAPMEPEVDILLGETPLDEDREETGPLGLSKDFAVACDVALDTLDIDVLGEILADETDEDSALLSFSVRSMLSDTDEIFVDSIAKDIGLTSLPELLWDMSCVPLEGDLLGDSPLDETDVETNRSILSARSILLDKAFVAEDAVALFGETPRDATDGRGLLILSVRSMLLHIAFTETLPPIIAGQRW